MNPRYDYSGRVALITGGASGLGKATAHNKGVYKGRRKTIDDADICRRVANGAPKAQVARDLGVSRMTVYRALEKPHASSSHPNDCAHEY